MVTCPNCNHQNPDGAIQCEACYTPLVAQQSTQATGDTCPQCGAAVHQDATFCGQCGFNLKANSSAASPRGGEISAAEVPSAFFEETPDVESNEEETEVTLQMMATVASTKSEASPQMAGTATAIQTLPEASLTHVQTNIPLDIPSGLDVIHIGKPNDVIPPDIDISGFPHSEVVSRVHADLRIENGTYYIEDTGSSNGTYVNHAPLPAGNRHRLRAGDRIAFGKGDKVTFLFQMNEV